MVCLTRVDMRQPDVGGGGGGGGGRWAVGSGFRRRPDEGRAEEDRPVLCLAIQLDALGVWVVGSSSEAIYIYGLGGETHTQATQHNPNMNPIQVPVIVSVVTRRTGGRL